MPRPRVSSQLSTAVGIGPGGDLTTFGGLCMLAVSLLEQVLGAGGCFLEIGIP